MGQSSVPEVAGGIGTNTSGGGPLPCVEVAPYATPNVRLVKGRYANFLHSDAVFPAVSSLSRKNKNIPSSDNTSTSAPLAMINVWIPLNDTPPDNNMLTFCELPQEQSNIYDNKLVGHVDHVEGNTLVYSDQMCWGSFYCFVAGESASSERVLLHGAVDIETKNEGHASVEGKKQYGRSNSIYKSESEASQRQVVRERRKRRNGKNFAEQRKSIELRYIVYRS